MQTRMGWRVAWSAPIVGMAVSWAVADSCDARMQRYRPATEVTISGTVEKVMGCVGRSSSADLSLWLRVEDRWFEVHLGPRSFLVDAGLVPARGDVIEVRGSALEFSGTDVVSAREMTRGGLTVTLRDLAGTPRWVSPRGVTRASR